jgi:myxalamid-type polyketide synthase MxaE and MxaD
MTKTEVEAWLVTNVANLLGLDPSRLDTRAPFASYGLDSANVVPLSGELEIMLDRRLSPTLLFEYPSIDELASHLAEGEALEPVAAASAAPGTPHRKLPAESDSEPIAIIGIGCRFPSASGPDAFWRLLRGGVDAISTVPEARWDADAFFDPDPLVPGKTISRWGGFIEGADLFDAAFFGISPREATRMDPQQRLLLEVTWEALENAGVLPERLQGSDTGVFIGISHSEYSDKQYSDPSFIDAYAATSNSLSIASNRLSYFFDLHGPSLSVDTACSSSLVSVHLACRSLRRRESSLALAGGVSLNFAPEISVAITKAGIMAPDGRCKPFDHRANGYVRGEGVAVVVLKSLAEALRDRDPIWAVIRGTAITQDGRTNGMMAPNQQAQEAVLRAACLDAGVPPDAIEYLEAHGTGTYLGDAIEAKAMGNVVGSGRTAAHACRIGSVKSNIGHLEPAAGIAGLIKVALALKHEAIPASLHFETPNPEIPFDELGLAVVSRLESWSGTPGIAGVSSFGFGGTNAHAVLERAPASPAASSSRRRALVLPLSARSPEALVRLAASYAELVREDDAALADICATAATRRLHHKHRLAVVGETGEELADRLTVFTRGRRVAGLHATSGPVDSRRLVFVFSGQGSQWPGMARDLMHWPAFRESLETCDALFARHARWSLLRELESVDGERLARTEIAQPAIFAVQVALCALLRSHGVTPDAVLGHSVGEIAAAYIAGALGLEDAVALVGHRGRIMDAAHGRGGMLSAALRFEDARRLVDELAPRLSLAALNGPESVALSGGADAISEALELLRTRGVAAQRIPVEYAFHSTQMDACGTDLAEAVAALPAVAPVIPLFSTVYGARVAGQALAAEHWRRNVCDTVRFAPAVQAAAEEGFDVFVEIGPHASLVRNIEDVLRDAGKPAAVHATMRKQQSADTTVASVLAALYSHGRSIAWQGLFADAGAGVHLPSFPWKRDRYWAEFVEQASSPNGSPRDGHVLLGAHTELVHAPGSHVWSANVDVGTIDGLGLAPGDARRLPAGATLEMLLSAAAAISPERPHALSELRIEGSATVGGDGVELQLHASSEHAGRRNLSLHARSIGDSGTGDWTLHASAGLPAGARVVPRRGRESLDALQSVCTEPLDPAAFQALVALRGSGGSDYQLVRELRRKGEHALARLRLPEAVKRTATPYAFHPLLLEACLHVPLASEVLAEGSGRWSVSSIERVVVHGSLGTSGHGTAPALRGGASFWVHAEVAHVDEGGVDADVRLFDDSGTAVLELLGTHFKAVRDGARVAAQAALLDGTWLYEVGWRAQAKSASSPRQHSGAPWLVLGDRGGLGDALARELQRLGHRCDTLDPSLASPDRSGELDQVLRDRLRNERFSGIVHLYGLDAGAEPSLEALAAGEDLGCATTLSVVKAIVAAGAKQPPRLWLVTRGAQAVVTAQRPAALAQAALWGLGRTLAFELPELRTTLVDVDSQPGAAAQLAAEISADRLEPQVALRGDQRFVARVLPATRTLAENAASFEPDATYLFSGGLGGLGLRLSRWLVEHGARHLALIGRRAPSAEVEDVLRELRALGAEVRVLCGDVADRARTAAILAEVRATMPSLRGVFHAAGVLDNAPALELDRERFAAVTSAKIAGGWNLHDLTRSDPLEHFVLFSSVASVIGPPGQANYSAGNAFLDALAALRHAEGLPIVNVNWGPWAEVGLAAQTVARMKHGRIPEQLSAMIAPRQGIEILGRLLRERLDQLLVLPWDLREIAAFYPEAQQRTVFGELGAASVPAKAPLASDRMYERPNLRQEYIGPRDDLERTIAEIWQRSLQIEQIGVVDSFFELGGDSVLGAQIIAQVNRSFTVSLSLRDSFKAFTIEELANAVKRQLMTKLDQLSDAEAQQLLAASSATN